MLVVTVQTSIESAMSASGRYVVYMSRASNLVAGDTNKAADIFLYDRTTRKTERVSVASGGAQLPGDSDTPAISADGRYVAFDSTGPGFVSQVWVRDRVAGTTTMVAEAGFHPSISGNGRYVAYQTSDGKIFVRDLVQRRTFLASVNDAGQPANGPTFLGAVGDTGVAFQSLARNVGGTPNGNYQVYYRSF